ncbi:MAG TPA: hypothetical protein VGG72_27750 [Bryobacteraceae bacterium]|jgi:hypothetical protein
MERRQEIAAIEAELLPGNSAIEGLVLALLRILQNEGRRRGCIRRRGGNRMAETQPFTE